MSAVVVTVPNRVIIVNQVFFPTSTMAVRSILAGLRLNPGLIPGHVQGAVSDERGLLNGWNKLDVYPRPVKQISRQPKRVIRIIREARLVSDRDGIVIVSSRTV